MTLYGSAIVCDWKTARYPSPGSIFPGRLVHELHWDYNGILDCNGIVRIVCHARCGFGLIIASGLQPEWCHPISSSLYPYAKSSAWIVLGLHGDKGIALGC